MKPKDASTATAPSGRADARRNHERLLATAQEVFFERGADASLEEVARRAGVGIGTLYRHFPNRQRLLEALVAGSYDRLTDRARELAAEPDPGTALGAWLRAFIAEVTAFHGMAASVMVTLRDESTDLFSSCQSMRSAGAGLFERARLADAVPEGTDFKDVLWLVGSIAMSTEREPEAAERLLALAVRGLMPCPNPPH